jgi:hypothetical protein
VRQLGCCSLLLLWFLLLVVALPPATACAARAARCQMPALRGCGKGGGMAGWQRVRARGRACSCCVLQGMRLLDCGSSWQSACGEQLLLMMMECAPTRALQITTDQRRSVRLLMPLPAQVKLVA